MNKNIDFTDEQEKFIADKSDFLIVSAGPGAGKTQTLVSYLDHINFESDSKDILVCSFTNNSTNEIKRRYEKYSKSGKSENINFKTFDSFMISELWKYYFNRIINFAIDKFSINHEHVKGISLKNISYNGTYWKELKENESKPSWLKERVSFFIQEGVKGNFISDIISEVVLYLFIKDNKSIVNYVFSRYGRIIVDEAQDLNKVRRNILLKFNTCGVKLTFVGDERQSLYAFSGAQKGSFTELINDSNIDTTLIELTKNFRYKDIEAPKNENLKCIFNSKNKDELKISLSKAVTNQDLVYVSSLSEELKRLQSDSVLIITPKNASVMEIDVLLSAEDIEHDYRKKVSDSIYKNYNDLIFVENLYLYNELKTGAIKSNELNIDVVQNISDRIWPGDPEANSKFLKMFWGKNIDYRRVVSDVCKKINLKEGPILYDAMAADSHLVSQLPIKGVKVMTIHGSKGLEADYVFFPQELINKFLVDNKYPGFESIYVALSRARKKIFLF